MRTYIFLKVAKWNLALKYGMRKKIDVQCCESQCELAKNKYKFEIASLWFLACEGKKEEP